MPFICRLGCEIMPILPFALPFAFVFFLINAQKCLQEHDLKFILHGILASVSLLLIIYALPVWLAV